MSMNKLTRLQHLVDLGNRTKTELDALDAKIQEIVTVGGEPNVIETVKVNGTALTVTDKAVDITVPEAYDDTALAGRVSAIEGDYLKAADKYDDTALAGRVSVIEGDYLKAADKYDDTELAGRVAANEEAIEVLNGTGEGSVDKKITDAFNEFSTNVTDDGVVNSYKELIDYAASHGSEFTALVGTVTEQGNAIDAVEGRMDTAEGKIEALEAIEHHSHDNKAVLDGITEAKVSAWDAAEGNAKIYADGLNTAMDARVQVVEGKAHEHANKAELDLIASGDKAKWDQAATDIGTVKADYLKASDKTALEGSISAVDAKFANYYTSAQVDAMIATDAEVTAALDEVFG